MQEDCRIIEAALSWDSLLADQRVLERYKPDLQVWHKLLDHLAQLRLRYVS